MFTTTGCNPRNHTEELDNARDCCPETEREREVRKTVHVRTHDPCGQDKRGEPEPHSFSGETVGINCVIIHESMCRVSRGQAHSGASEVKLQVHSQYPATEKHSLSVRFFQKYHYQVPEPRKTRIMRYVPWTPTFPPPCTRLLVGARAIVSGLGGAMHTQERPGMQEERRHNAIIIMAAPPTPSLSGSSRPSCFFLVAFSKSHDVETMPKHQRVNTTIQGVILHRPAPTRYRSKSRSLVLSGQPW